MTKEEIIDFCEMKSQLEPENEDIFNYIIKALSLVPCGDAISRQAVQDYIAKYLSQYLYDDVREAFEAIDEFIGELPPVNPQKNIVNNGTMNITL